MNKPIVPWVGGKTRLAKHLLPLFPHHQCYVEPFCGAAGLYFAKEPSQVEVLNDINGELVRLYRVVQHHLEEFVRQFKWALSSRQIFEWQKMTRPETLTDIQRAARFITEKSAKECSMATMSIYKTKTGEARYKFEIRLKKDGAIIHQESKTFSSKTVGKDWAKRRESELEKHGVIEAYKHKGVSLKQVMLSLFAATEHKFGRTRNSNIKFMANQGIAEIDVVAIKTGEIIKHCQERSASGADGATILQDISAIKSALKYAKSALGLPVTVTIIDEASEYLRDNRIIYKAKKRKKQRLDFVL